MKLRGILPIVFACAVATAKAQQGAPGSYGYGTGTPSPNRPGWALSGSSRADWVSPDVHADHTITFRFSAPTAREVKLTFAGKSYAMNQDEKGVWIATVGPVDPDIYDYSFEIGGAQVNSDQVEVPGKATPRYDEQQGVPHGSMTLRRYESKVQGRQRSFRIYLPPQYYSEPNRKFPVLYMFYGMDEAGWMAEGRMDIVLDNLIAANKAAPMVIVMPNSSIHGENLLQRASYAATATTPEARAGLASAAETVAVLEKELPNEIMPIVEKDYRVYTDRSHRAIAGLSFGGSTAFAIGMRHLDWFDYIGELGTGTFGGLDNPTDGYVSYLIPYDPEKIAPGIYKNLTDPALKPKLFYMACGADDPRRPFQEKAYEDFKKHGFDPVWETFPGTHEFKFFRRALADFATRIFK